MGNWGVRFGVLGSRFWDPGSRGSGLWFRVWGFEVEDLSMDGGCGDLGCWDLGFGVWGLGSRGSGVGR